MFFPMSLLALCVSARVGAPRARLTVLYVVCRARGGWFSCTRRNMSWKYLKRLISRSRIGVPRSCVVLTITRSLRKSRPGLRVWSRERGWFGRRWLNRLPTRLWNGWPCRRVWFVHDKLVAMGYAGSERTTRRVVSAAKKQWRRGTHRIYRPWVPEPGLWLQWDYGDGPVVDGTKTVLFIAWLAWSRFRVILALRDARCHRLLPGLIRRSG